MSIPSSIKEPCCENFCLETTSTEGIPKYSSNLNLYIKQVIDDNSLANPDNTKYTWNNFTNSYEPIWEWRGFMRTFASNEDTFPIRLIQNSPNQGTIWFLQVRNWTNSNGIASQNSQNDYGILAYYTNTINNVNNYPIGSFTLNDSLTISPPYEPKTNTPLSSLISKQIKLSQGYCTFQSS